MKAIIISIILFISFSASAQYLSGSYSLESESQLLDSIPTLTITIDGDPEVEGYGDGKVTFYSFILLHEQDEDGVWTSYSMARAMVDSESMTLRINNLEGVLNGYPTFKDVNFDIGAPLDGDPNNTDPSNLNVQYISANIVLNRVN